MAIAQALIICLCLVFIGLSLHSYKIDEIVIDSDVHIEFDLTLHSVKPLQWTRALHIGWNEEVKQCAFEFAKNSTILCAAFSDENNIDKEFAKYFCGIKLSLNQKYHIEIHYNMTHFTFRIDGNIVRQERKGPHMIVGHWLHPSPIYYCRSPDYTEYFQNCADVTIENLNITCQSAYCLPYSHGECVKHQSLQTHPDFKLTNNTAPNDIAGAVTKFPMANNRSINVADIIINQTTRHVLGYIDLSEDYLFYDISVEISKMRSGYIFSIGDEENNFGALSLSQDEFEVIDALHILRGNKANNKHF